MTLLKLLLLTSIISSTLEKFTLEERTQRPIQICSTIVWCLILALQLLGFKVRAANHYLCCRFSQKLSRTAIALRGLKCMIMTRLILADHWITLEQILKLIRLWLMVLVTLRVNATLIEFALIRKLNIARTTSNLLAYILQAWAMQDILD